MAGLINNFTKKIDFSKQSIIKTNKLMDLLMSVCLTDKGNFSIKKLEASVSNIDDIYNSTFPKNLKLLCESYSKKRNKRKKALAFARRIIEKSNRLKKSNIEFELCSNRKIKDFIEKSKPLRRMLNCSNEEFINILFNDSKVVTTAKKSTLLRYLHKTSSEI